MAKLTEEQTERRRQVSQYCEDCGTRMGSGICPNCDEEVVIMGQYLELDMEVPAMIRRKADEQIARRRGDTE